MAAAQYFEQVQKIFIAFYQRPADPAGLKYWAQRVDAAGGDFGAVIDAFAASPEAVALYGAIDATTIGTVIDKLYLALFNTAPDAAGKKFYVDGFIAGTFSAGTIALNVLNGATGDDAVAVANKVQVANNFTQQVDGRPWWAWAVVGRGNPGGQAVPASLPQRSRARRGRRGVTRSRHAGSGHSGRQCSGGQCDSAFAAG